MHNLIVGITGSGKNTLAKIFTKRLESKETIVVYDPTKSEGW